MSSSPSGRTILDVAYLLIHKLPTAAELTKSEHEVTFHTFLHRTWRRD